jgi:DNA-binding SARP family transcriptional activator
MWFEMLGSLRVVDEGVEMPVAGTRQRIVLGALLANANQPVSAGRLAEFVWDGAPPAGAAATLRTYVRRLRRGLGPRGAARILTRDPGYMIEVGVSEVDALLFEALCRDASAAARAGHWAAAAEAGDRALGLWHGTPLADVPCQTLLDEWYPRLEQLHLQAVEGLVDAELHLERYDQVVTRLQGMTVRHPLHERFHAQLMLALARSGRQAEALAVYQGARRVLVAELGLEPGPELRELQERILAGDVALAMPAPAASASVSASASASASPPQTPEVPRQLPSAVRHFTGRTREVDRLAELADEAGRSAAGGAVVISAIDGMAGVGKTALAVHVAHRIAPMFPDGQLFVDMHGYTEGFRPRAASEVLESFLRALGVQPKQVPENAEERATLYRERLAGTRTMIVLDNVSGEAQVRPLLPGSSGCMVLVTSRRRLKGLDDAYSFPLDVLPLDDAVALFCKAARLERDPADGPILAEIVQLCGRLPLALRIAAALIRHRHAWRPAHLAEKLREGSPGLAGFDDGDRELANVFELSYQTLDEPQQLLFRLLGIVPGPDIDAHACAALLGTAQSDAERRLESLVDHNLLNQPTAGRYRLHDLIRLYARALADADPAGRTASAIDRLVAYYAQAAAWADARIARARRPGDSGEHPAYAPPLADPDEVSQWLRAERPNIEASIQYAINRGRDDAVYSLATGLTTLLRVDGHWNAAVGVHATALAATRRIADRLGEANTLAGLGDVRRVAGDFSGATRDFEHALSIYRELGDRLGQANTLSSLGTVWMLTGDFPSAVSSLETALNLYRALDDLLGQANVLNSAGPIRVMTGDYQGALRDFEQSLELFRQLGHDRGRAIALTSLGAVRQRVGDYQGAIRDLRHALELTDRIGYRQGHANALTLLGAARRLIGEAAGAVEDLEEALRLFRDLGSRDGEAFALNHYATVVREAGDRARALRLYRDALRLARVANMPDEQAHALEGIGESLLYADDTHAGIDQLNQALDIYKRLGMPDFRRIEERLAALHAP